MTQGRQSAVERVSIRELHAAGMLRESATKTAFLDYYGELVQTAPSDEEIPDIAAAVAQFREKHPEQFGPSLDLMERDVATGRFKHDAEKVAQSVEDAARKAGNPLARPPERVDLMERDATGNFKHSSVQVERIADQVQRSSR